MDILVEAEAITQEEADAALADVRYTNDLEDAVRGADFVQECIPERLQLKQDTYRTIQNVTGPDTVIASFQANCRRALCIRVPSSLDIRTTRLICFR